MFSNARAIYTCHVPSRLQFVIFVGMGSRKATANAGQRRKPRRRTTSGGSKPEDSTARVSLHLGLMEYQCSSMHW